MIDGCPDTACETGAGAAAGADACRFGVGCGYQPFVQMSDRRQIDVAAFHHVLETRVKLFHALDTLGRSPIQTIPHISGTQEVPAMSLKATKITAWGEAASAKPQGRVHNAHAP